MRHSHEDPSDARSDADAALAAVVESEKLAAGALLAGEMPPSDFEARHIQNPDLRKFAELIIEKRRAGFPIESLADEVGADPAAALIIFPMTGGSAAEAFATVARAWRNRQRQAALSEAAEAARAGDTDREAKALERAEKHRERPAFVFTGQSLADYISADTPDPTQTLLGERRFLCRHGACLLIGPSGIGKSSASAQQDMCWALGLPAFGIQPARPLRILTVQAENDDGDLIEMAQGVAQGLDLDRDDLDAIAERTRYESVSLTGDEFLTFLDAAMTRFKPDLVRIDPLQSFADCDLCESGKLLRFLTRLGALLKRHNAGCIIAHHTPKTNHRDTGTWSATDWAYAGAGAAVLTNWARAVVVIEPLGSGVFSFKAPKRGNRIGWADDIGNPTTERFFKHAGGGAIYWEDISEEEAEALKDAAQENKAAAAAEKMRAAAIAELEREGGRMQKKFLIQALNQKHKIGLNRVRTFIQSEAETFREVPVPNDRGPALIYIEFNPNESGS